MDAKFSRNLGLLSKMQQQQLSKTHVIVSGVGGMGGVAAEALVRMGVGELTILDHDIYETSNLNRQIHSSHSVLGRQKVEVVREKLLDINPDLKIHSYHGLSTQNVSEVLGGADLVINGMDDVLASIILEREARRKGITIVDAWITPYASVFVMQSGSPHWEEFLDFPTLGKPIKDITPADVSECLRREVAFTLGHFNPYKVVDQELVEQILAGEVARPSLVPVVWLSGTLMANEAMKIFTGQGHIASHWGVFYNQYDHEIKVLKEGGLYVRSFDKKMAS